MVLDEKRSMICLSQHRLHILKLFHVKGEGVRRSIERLIRRLIKAGARVSYHTKRWAVHAASSFPLARHDWAVFTYG